MLRNRTVRMGWTAGLVLALGCADPGSASESEERGPSSAQEAEVAPTPSATPSAPATPEAKPAPANPAPVVPTAEPIVQGRKPPKRANARPASEVAGAATTPLSYDDDPDVRCYQFRAYNTVADKESPYMVPTTPDIYTSFTFKAPWQGTQYLKSASSLLDNLPVIHHWMLLRQHNGGEEKVTPNASGIHGDGDILHSWAPGADDIFLGAEVGMELPGGTLLMLENHYYNRTGAASPDHSGAEICVTPKKPKNLAGLSYVGTDMINGISATGTCTHQSKEPVHIIMTFPHMHKKGIHMKVDLTTASGTSKVLHDKPFDFDYQRAYVDEIVLQPGDKVRTTCTFDSPAKMGKGTDQEMCFYFSLHYPAGQLFRKNFYQALHGPNTCID
ncbi:MAG: hypothetical protein ABW252_03060 [Polyangiales bacterium]